MKYKSILMPLQTAALLLIGGLFQLAVAQVPCSDCHGFPDKDGTSGRMITVAIGEQTLGDVAAGEKVVGIELQVPKSLNIPVGSKFQVGIFDGDIGGDWDTATGTPDVLNYFVFADGGKLQPVSGTDLLALANGGTQVDSQFAGMNNSWALFNVTQDLAAQNANGDFFYHFVAKWKSTNNPNELNLFKVSVQGLPYLPAGSTIGILGTDNSINGGPITIPGAPIYDGSFTFVFNVTTEPTQIRLWDGDADRADDSDDPNTGTCLQKKSTDPVCPDIPFQVSSAATPEGTNPGNPDIFPNVRYNVTGPFGAVNNNNPSGNQEIELFRIGKTGDATADVTVPSIPVGVYKWNWQDVGVFNNFFIHADYDLFTCEGNAALCQPPPPTHNFDCYEVPRSSFSQKGVNFTDRFGTTTSNMTEFKRVCLPADINGKDQSAVNAPENLAVFTLDNTTGKFAKGTTVNIVNQFGTLKGDIGQPVYLMSPSSMSTTDKNVAPLVSSTPSLQCYNLNNVTTSKNVKGIQVNDQLLNPGGLTLDLDNRGPWQLCVPTSVNGSDSNAVQNPNAQLCYKTNNDKLPFGEKWVFVNTPFGLFPALLTQYDALCVPSTIGQ